MLGNTPDITQLINDRARILGSSSVTPVSLNHCTVCSLIAKAEMVELWVCWGQYGESSSTLHLSY